MWCASAMALLSLTAAGSIVGQSGRRAPRRARKAHAVAVTFADTAPYVVRIDATQGRSAFTMELANADSVDHTVVLRLSRGEPTPADRAPLPVRFVPNRVTVPGRVPRTRSFQVLASLPHVVGVWVAYAVAEDADSASRVAVRQLWVVVPTVQPLVSSWVVRAWRNGCQDAFT